jgi:hypothetical protein
MVNPRFPHASKTLTHSAVKTWLSSAGSSFSVTQIDAGLLP